MLATNYDFLYEDDSLDPANAKHINLLPVVCVSLLEFSLPSHHPLQSLPSLKTNLALVPQSLIKNTL